MTMDDTPSSDHGTAPRWRNAPLWRVILSQIVGGVAAYSASLMATKLTEAVVPGIAILLAGGLIAAFIGHVLKLPKWWIPVQIILPPAAALGTGAPVPGWVFLVLFAALALVFWNSARGQVPLYLTNRLTWQQLLRLIHDRSSFSFVDLGCGVGGALIYLAKMRPDARFIGIESAPIPFLIAWIRARLSGHKNLSIRYGDIWKEDLSSYDVVYAFLSPAPMPRLYEKVTSEMAEGSLFISNSFVVPEKPPQTTVSVEDGRQTQLHLWTN